MFPTLFTIPFLDLPVHTYGVMAAIGFFLGMQIITRQAEKQGLPSGKILDLCFYVILASIVGSRIFFIVVEEPSLLKTPLEWIKIWEGGLVFYGGFIGALTVGIWYLRKHKLPFLKTVDIFALALPLGHGMGRIGCFFAGCCFGKHAPDFPLAIRFPDLPNAIAPAGVPLYPTQLMEALGEFIVFLLLYFISDKKKFDGQILLLYFITYSVLRFGVEFFRGDDSRGFLFHNLLSVSQVISLCLFIAGLSLWKFLSRKAKIENL